MRDPRPKALVSIAALPFVLAAAASPGARAAAPHAAASAVGSASAAAPHASASASAKPVDHVAVARASVVVLERQGKPVGLGTVLARDGRILTALSALGDGNGVDARYQGGEVVRLRTERVDRAWDLALLAPQGAPAAAGLPAGDGDPLQTGTPFVAFGTGTGRGARVTATLRGRKSVLGADGVRLDDVLDVGGVSLREIGSPIVDVGGTVAAVVVRGCASATPGPCASVPVGAPVAALRAFLAAAPPPAPSRALPWFGAAFVADGAGASRGLRVKSVAPGSPAAIALRPGASRDQADMLVAIDGVPVTTPDAASALVLAHRPGDRVRLLVLGAGLFRDVPLVLGETPAPVAPAAPEAPTAPEAPAAPTPR